MRGTTLRPEALPESPAVEPAGAAGDNGTRPGGHFRVPRAILSTSKNVTSELKQSADLGAETWNTLSGGKT